MPTVDRTRDRGADLVVEALRAQGVGLVTSVTGGAIMEQLDALGTARDIDLRTFQTEQGAAWAAVGYARVRGRAGVTVVTSGPAATNTVTPVADALRDCIPLVVFTGQVPTTARNTDAFQETNITEIAAPSVKKVYYLGRAEEIPEVVADAFATAEQGRPGPVLIDITKDAQQAAIDLDSWRDSIRPAADPRATAPRVDEQAIDAVIELLREAEAPVAIIGHGVVLSGADAEARAFCERTTIPVVHTLPGKSGFPNPHRQNFGMLGMHGFYIANWLVHNADLVISLGARYDDRITGDPRRFAPRAKRLVHFDIDPGQIDKVLPERKLGVLADLKVALTAVNERLDGVSLDFAPWHARIRTVLREHPSTYTRQAGVLQTQHALERLNAAVQTYRAQTGRPVIYAVEVGAHQQCAGQYLELHEPRSFLTSSGQGAMGSGLPQAIGAQLAAPDALVICVAGDGSLRMSEAELETIVEERLPVKVLVLNNCGYGIVRMWNHRFYGGRETGVVKRRKDWELLARANGFSEVSRVSNPDALDAAYARVLASREPSLLELQTPYAECLPFTPPGRSFDDIIER